MVRKIAALLALLLTIGFVAPVAAQDVDTSDLKEFGLESGYVRMYMSSDTASPLVGVMVGGFEFDDAENAEKHFEDFSCGFASGFMGQDETKCEDLEAGGITVTDVDGIGDKSMEFAGTADIGGESPTLLMTTLKDNYIFVVINIGDDTEGSADGLAKFLADAEPVDTEVVFSEDGTSTGGFYDMVPAADDELLTGLTPMADMDMFDAATSTPAS